MKDENDIQTEDAFISFEEVERQDFITNALVCGGHYQAVKTPSFLEVSGRRYAGSTTPDAVRDLWATHPDIIEYMQKHYGDYDLDAAASENNAVCRKFYDEKTNCLKRWWGSNKHVWLNPPYSHPDPFVAKAIEQIEHGNQIDMLLPGDSSTAWFADAQRHAAEIIWITGEITEEGKVRSGRLAFVSGDTGLPVSGNNKGSVIMIMRQLKEGEQQTTRYVPIGDIFPTCKNKRARKRSI